MMLTEVSLSQRIQLAAPWQAYPIPLDATGKSRNGSGAELLTIPTCAHLQTALYPDQPYWGDRLRRLNEQNWVYTQSFTAPATPFKRARLLCEGIDYFAAVWLNDQYVGRHEGHYAPFTLDVTDAIKRGAENTLAIRVSAPWDKPNPGGGYPVDHVLRGLVKGLYEHAEGVIPPNINPLGIWRPVWLLLDNGLSIDKARIRTALDGTVDLRLNFSNTTGANWQGQLDLEVVAENHDGPGAQVTIPVNLAPGMQEIDYPLHIPEPCLWWPWDHGDPNLYRLTASLKNQGTSHSEVFGLRTVELERSPKQFVFRINERPISLRGSAYMPGVYLSLCDRAWLTRDLDFARRANLNLLRVHVHVSPPELYDLCDRAGMLIWQDSELNWSHETTPEFEARALKAQRDMITLLGNHPSIMTWACHNEPTMIFTRRENLEERPDPALYADALQQDPTRPIYICSGQMEGDWRRAGDAHTYYGALWSNRYTDVYRHRYLINTEFGFEAPAAPETLQAYPEAWDRLKHLDGQIEALWAYQAELVQYHVEHLRRLRAEGCAGYVHFWLADLAPQVGCGVLDSRRAPKGGYEALRRASQPLLVSLEHDGRRPCALWVFNDTLQAHPGAEITWQVYDAADRLLLESTTAFDVAPNASQRVSDVQWAVTPADCARIELTLRESGGAVLVSNTYRHPFQPTLRPRGYPWKFDPILACKVFDRPDAPSLADLGGSKLTHMVPLRLREQAAEWALRQRLPTWLLSAISRLIRHLM
jgi:beta-mannosidase